jgi:protein translocase SecG subunit
MFWFFYVTQIIIIGCIIGIVLVQKTPDNILGSNKFFGIRGRSNMIARITYFFVFLFIINTLYLGVSYKRLDALVVKQEDLVNK